MTDTAPNTPARHGKPGSERPEFVNSGQSPIPQEIRVSATQRLMTLCYEPPLGEFALSFELLRVYSPSAEVTGHGPGQEVLQTEKESVSIVQIEPVGQYAVKPVFSDGHQTGIYSWNYLWWLCQNRDLLWRDYLQRLESAGKTRTS